MSVIIDTPIEYLKGIGPKKAVALKKEINVKTYRDLLHYFPFRYVDRTQFHKVIDIPGIEGYVQLKVLFTVLRKLVLEEENGYRLFLETILV